MLITSHRHTKADLTAWGQYEKKYKILYHVRRNRFKYIENKALLDINKFYDIQKAWCYFGVSWGKDSTVLAHLLYRSQVPIPSYHFRYVGAENPDSYEVRDMFLKRWPLDYHELNMVCINGEWDVDEQQAKKILDAGGLGAHMTGVRAGESQVRRLRSRRWGVFSLNACAPLDQWTTEEIFSYMLHYDLPIHPMYACTLGGMFDHLRLRVDQIGGDQGTEHGREEHEKRYYSQEWARAQNTERNSYVENC